MKTALALIATLCATYAVAEAPLRIVPGKPLRMRGGQTAVLGTLTARLTAVHHPISRDANGLEHFPFTDYTLSWSDRSGKTQVGSVSPWTSKMQADLLGQYTFTIGPGAPDTKDEITLTVFAHSCLLRYTSANQLQHANGKIIFDEHEDPCCAYSDGASRCDLDVRRAHPPRTPGPYCTIYSTRTKAGEVASTDEGCCCRYEGGERIDPACAAACAVK